MLIKYFCYVCGKSIECSATSIRDIKLKEEGWLVVYKKYARVYCPKCRKEIK